MKLNTGDPNTHCMCECVTKLPLLQDLRVTAPQQKRDLGPNFRNFLGRSWEDFFSKESMQIFATSLETS